ncbi:hypothetical protein ACH4FX_21940 [Streptomyces sp. NPDC018019]|uniref:hypothetical protein n=1 Tax=Streptomyces sp. NPDC018019 TaxID=3365030 RepID=UPI0037B68B09
MLAGDAATVARPHTGSGAVKALQDAVALEAACAAAGDWSEVAAAYDAARGPVGMSVMELGRRLGDVLVLRGPDWRTVHQADLDALWAEADEGAFGGRALPGAPGPGGPGARGPGPAAGPVPDNGTAEADPPPRAGTPGTDGTDQTWDGSPSGAASSASATEP